MGADFAGRAAALARIGSWRGLVNGGRMPPGGKLPASRISLIAAWIDAGAMNN
ncbi:MAG TPA: hypothetical protein VMT03_02440 [Polyangia bacterium]|nr:hypothetical protein [Polyangia bacterium]